MKMFWIRPWYTACSQTETMEKELIFKTVKFRD